MCEVRFGAKIRTCNINTSRVIQDSPVIARRHVCAFSFKCGCLTSKLEWDREVTSSLLRDEVFFIFKNIYKSLKYQKYLYVENGGI
ncbi:hypothetical protein SAMN02745163_02729 [Clostridium cavendishii DSM 21758]|uniref:Uncharacterized protein n=1 Tax=Clostridium cavendishii DSM 21758 TaxID=1121302 RepID=A0A1M6MRF1_9CLOT|nr:hypothetical protein SAMN02745163_02729 [Clostridium cavendishii DSM 21758]